jgi:hypothetical protein
MKKLTIIFLMTCLIKGCTSKEELSREEASRIIKESMKYPIVIDYDIYCSDPEAAKKVIDAGLEKEGLVTVQRTQKLSDAGKPLIEFTSKAQSYLLPTAERDKAIHVQKVKLADEDFIEVTGIKTMEDGKKAVAEYTTAYKNVSGFSALTDINFNQSHTRKANFALYDDGWKAEKKQ